MKAALIGLDVIMRETQHSAPATLGTPDPRSAVRSPAPRRGARVRGRAPLAPPLPLARSAGHRPADPLSSRSSRGRAGALAADHDPAHSQVRLLRLMARPTFDIRSTERLQRTSERGDRPATPNARKGAPKRQRRFLPKVVRRVTSSARPEFPRKLQSQGMLPALAATPALAPENTIPTQGPGESYRRPPRRTPRLSPPHGGAAAQ